jgi:hypothetical protein
LIGAVVLTNQIGWCEHFYQEDVCYRIVEAHVAQGTFLPFILSNPIGSFIWWTVGVETRGLTCESLKNEIGKEYKLMS